MSTVDKAQLDLKLIEFCLPTFRTAWPTLVEPKKIKGLAGYLESSAMSLDCHNRRPQGVITYFATLSHSDCHATNRTTITTGFGSCKTTTSRSSQ